MKALITGAVPDLDIAPETNRILTNEEYKNNGFEVNKLGDYPLKLETKPE